MNPNLTVRGLVTGYIPNIPVLHELDLDVAPGSVVGIMGANGAGKSTLAAAIAGVLRVWSGSVTVGDWDCTHASPSARVTHGLIPVPENRRLFGQLTVIENLRAAAYVAKKDFTPARRSAIEKEFPIVERKASAHCSVLSGGEQQMVALARARLMDPKFVILDEPSLGLSPAVTSELAEVIRRFAASGVGVVLIEQNVTLIERICDRTRLLNAGRFMQDMSASQLAKREAIIAAYLGAPTDVKSGPTQSGGPVEASAPLQGVDRDD